MNIMLNEIIVGNINVLVLIVNLLCEFNGNYWSRWCLKIGIYFINIVFVR